MDPRGRLGCGDLTVLPLLECATVVLQGDDVVVELVELVRCHVITESPLSLSPFGGDHLCVYGMLLEAVQKGVRGTD